MSIAETRFSRKRGAGGPGTAPEAGWDLEEAASSARRLHGCRTSELRRSVSAHRISEFASAATLESFSASRRGSGEKKPHRLWNSTSYQLGPMA